MSIVVGHLIQVRTILGQGGSSLEGGGQVPVG
jgi:hypothetical protein